MLILLNKEKDKHFYIKNLYKKLIFFSPQDYTIRQFKWRQVVRIVNAHVPKKTGMNFTEVEEYFLFISILLFPQKLCLRKQPGPHVQHPETDVIQPPPFSAQRALIK